MQSKKIKQLEKKYIMQTYGRYDLALDYGKGCYVYDFNKNKYLDFITGIACVPVGHSNKKVTKAITKQAKKLVQVSNLYYTESQVKLAQKLVKISGMDKCFFCNSGAEANEAAIKLAKKITKKKKFIAFSHSFHGRTSSSLAVTYKEKYKEPFKPLTPDVFFAKYNDIGDLEKTIKKAKDIAAVIVEPIQGEAGIIVPKKGFLKKVENLCKKNKILLIIDEVQTGNGKTGKFFCFQHEKIKPDIVTTAKGLANGVPIGVTISNGIDFDKGNHASTFGGNNLACEAALATINEIEKLMHKAPKLGNYFQNKLKDINSPLIKEIKGKGLMIGVEFKNPIALDVVKKCIKKGLLINNPNENTIRFLPPLIIKKKHINQAIKVLTNVLEEI